MLLEIRVRRHYFGLLNLLSVSLLTLSICPTICVFNLSQGYGQDISNVEAWMCIKHKQGAGPLHEG